MKSFLILFSLYFTTFAKALPVYEMDTIVLYNDKHIFEARSPNAEELSVLIKAINEQLEAIWAKEKKLDVAGKRGIVAVAIRPNGTMKLWVDLERKSQPEITALLQKQLVKQPIPKTRMGPIAFLMHYQLGKPPKPRSAENNFQIPQVWRDAVDQLEDIEAFIVPDDILPLVWPKKAGDPVHPEVIVPDGFVLQKLNPLGGEILRPKDWFYSEGHRENIFMWTISKEDQKNGYTTGYRIQFVLEVKKTGKTPEKFVKDYLKQLKEKPSVKVLSERKEIDHGDYKRLGLEVEETNGDDETLRILYSCFWSNKHDTMIISIAGTTKDLWAQHVGAFNHMRDFKLMDADEIKKQNK